MTNAPCKPLFDDWQLTIPWWQYLIYSAGLAFVFRLLHSLWRASAAARGDFPHDRKQKQVVIPPYWKAFWYCFKGFNEFKEHSDLWIPFFIGVIELTVYPVLLVLGQILIIGGWLGIKTAGGWMGWQASRTSFNRFLLFNLLNLLVSYLWLFHFIHYVPCPTSR